MTNEPTDESALSRLAGCLALSRDARLKPEIRIYTD